MDKITILNNKKCQIELDDVDAYKRLHRHLSFKLAGVEFTPAFVNGWSGITYLMTKGGPGDATRTLSELIYDTAFSFLNIGKASAMSFTLLLIALLLAFVQFSFLQSKDA